LGHVTASLHDNMHVKSGSPRQQLQTTTTAAREPTWVPYIEFTAHLLLSPPRKVFYFEQMRKKLGYAHSGDTEKREYQKLTNA
jgi:hypothetical protein